MRLDLYKFQPLKHFFVRQTYFLVKHWICKTFFVRSREMKIPLEIKVCLFQKQTTGSSKQDIEILGVGNFYSFRFAMLSYLNRCHIQFTTRLSARTLILTRLSFFQRVTSARKSIRCKITSFFVRFDFLFFMYFSTKKGDDKVNKM